MVEPVLKWAGGKKQVSYKIKSFFPPESDVNAYHEPFFGGGALFFKIEPQWQGSTINDINTRLMNFYRIVRDYPKELIETLEGFKSPRDPPVPNREFSDRNRKGDRIREYYYQQRELFNRRPNGEDYDEVEEAALLMYLNRTCYNGLYRENTAGEFNVPIGNPRNPNWAQASQIMEAHQVLQDVTILDGDFDYVLGYASEDDFVYFDPPPATKPSTTNFAGCIPEGFEYNDQKRLRDLAVTLAESGVDVVLSISNTATIKLYDVIETSVSLKTVPYDPTPSRQVTSKNEEKNGKAFLVILSRGRV